MKIIESVKYYTANEVGMLIGRSGQMIKLWDKWSDEREAKGEERFIPRSTRLGVRRDKYWSEYEVQILLQFANKKPMGAMKEYSRRQWSSRYMPKPEETLEDVISNLETKYAKDIKLADTMLYGEEEV